MTGMQLIRSKKGLSALVARELGISRGAVSMWQDVPLDRLLEIERVTGISRVLLRPDMYAGIPTNGEEAVSMPAPSTQTPVASNRNRSGGSTHEAR